MSDRSLSRFVVVPTIAVVLVLGWLLYRWSNQVSEATTVRLADSLQMSMVNWHLNLFRDLADVALAMRVDSATAGEERFRLRFLDWRETAPYAGVVAQLYVLREDGPSLGLASDGSRFERVEWPPALRTLLPGLEPGSETPPAEGGAFYSLGGVAGWSYEPSTPALVRPLEGDGEWLVLELDIEVIRSRMLPDLARRYFMGVDGLDYLVAVVSGPEPREVIYTSDPGFGDDEVADADGRMDVFGEVTARSLGSPIHVFHKLSQSAGLTGLAAALGTSWFRVIGSPSDEFGWQLVVRHRRGGALGAFVAEMQRRDLAISFGALSLLVLSVAMLIVSSRRASRLAQLQMDFVTAVSHELRSPLAIIKSAAENIAHGVVGSGEHVARYGSVIEGQARRLSRLVEEVLLFAATKEDRHRYDVTTLEAGEIVERALSETADLVEASGFIVERDVPAGLPPIRGDLAALSQCLENLITNALKYSGGEKWIGIRVRVEDGTASGREVVITVLDRGIGIDPGDLPHVFEPFFRGTRATAAQIHGTGLGLSLARRIAEAMSGRMTARSAPGGGSEFSLHLLPYTGPDEG